MYKNTAAWQPPAPPSPPPPPMTAWQRWEMAPVSAERGRAIAPEPAPAPAPALAPLAPVLLIDEAELARLRLEARQAGQAQGYQEGHARGLAEGQAAGLAEMQAQAAQLRALAQAWPAALRRADQDVAQTLLALALDIARQVLGQALEADPQAILPLVRDLLQAEPALTGEPHLWLHPDDAALVRKHLAEDLQSAGWRMRVDEHLQRGGCRVLAAGGEKDATVQTRWERVAAALARPVAAQE